MDYTDQIARIIQKLVTAKQADIKLEEFGAESHQYVLGTPATEEEITAFELKHKIALPEAYRLFLRHIGNGGIDYPNSIVGNAAAGPYFGIYKLGEPRMDILGELDSGRLEKQACLEPDMEEEEWDEMDDVGRFYHGVLVIGYCGCSEYQAIVLNGPHTGRILLVYDEDYCPLFLEEMNFLDWYENWLDGIIAKYKA